MQLFDDELDANRDIEVDQPDSTHVNVKIPFELRLSNFEGSLPILSPMGVSGDLMISVKETIIMNCEFEKIIFAELKIRFIFAPPFK